MIRVATLADIDALVTMGCRFLSETSYRQTCPPNADQLGAVAATFLTAPDHVAFVSERAGAITGMLLALAFDHPLSGQRVASELCWWMNPEARKGGDGLRLLRAAEQWARAQGARVLQMMAPAGEPIGTLYDRRGYTVTETHYSKVLA